MVFGLGRWLSLIGDESGIGYKWYRFLGLIETGVYQFLLVKGC